MKAEEYKKLFQVGKAFNKIIPINDKTVDLFNNLEEGEILEFKIAGNRDISKHRAYFCLLGYIYDYLPLKFKKSVDKEYFYTFLKYCFDEVKIIFTFKNGLQIIEPISISFSKMNDLEFKEYVKNQLPKIYTEIIEVLFKQDQAKAVIENIESDFERVFIKYFN